MAAPATATRRRLPDEQLRVKERGQLFVSWQCPDHGFLVATTPNATVVCKCRKRAKAHVDGRQIDSRELGRIRKLRAKSLQRGR